ncbi:MAG: anthranilate phosphoribosyltransferase [Moraxella sp.]|nr:anthranilate phosphoribosyltransferase [Moraxella sp.]
MNTADTTDIISKLNYDEINAILTRALHKILNNINLPCEQMREIMLIIMQGRCSDALMGAILAGLRMKGETIEEITAAAEVMLSLADKIVLPSTQGVVDIVGTGGDGANLFNVSTAAVFVAAAAGVTVAKHGNRGVSTKSGSSDLLETAGVRLDLDKEQTLRCINEQGIGFLFAPNHHTAMKHAIGVRRELKARTIFNILGPLTNPAGVVNSVIGVFNSELCEPLAYVLKNLGARHVMVVSAQDGLDEFSLATATHVAELKKGVVSTYEILPEDVGIASQSLQGLTISSSAESLSLIQAALDGKATEQARILKARDTIALNAGAAIYVAGRASSYANGVNMAQTIIQNGTALHKLNNFVKFSQSL